MKDFLKFHHELELELIQNLIEEFHLLLLNRLNQKMNDVFLLSILLNYNEKIKYHRLNEDFFQMFFDHFFLNLILMNKDLYKLNEFHFPNE